MTILKKLKNVLSSLIARVANRVYIFLNKQKNGLQVNSYFKKLKQKNYYII